jgi:hypothetical protein
MTGRTTSMEFRCCADARAKCARVATGSVAPPPEAMARTSAARSQGRRSKHQPPTPARCCSTGTYSNARPRTGFPGHASCVIAAATARWSHSYRPCLADGYQQSPAVNDGSLRSVLTWPFGVGAGAALPRGSAFQARDPGPRWGRTPPEDHGQPRIATVSRPRRSVAVSERSPRSSNYPDCLSHGGGHLELHRAKARHDLLHKPTGGTRTALGRWPHSQLVGQLADLRRRVAPVATERL